MTLITIGSLIQNIKFTRSNVLTVTHYNDICLLLLNNVTVPCQIYKWFNNSSIFEFVSSASLKPIYTFKKSNSFSSRKVQHDINNIILFSIQFSYKTTVYLPYTQLKKLFKSIVNVQF